MRILDFRLRLYKTHLGKIDFLLFLDKFKTNSVHWLAKMDSHAPKLVVTEELAEKSEHSSCETRVVELARFAAQTCRKLTLDPSSDGIAEIDIDANQSRRICPAVRRVDNNNYY